MNSGAQHRGYDFQAIRKIYPKWVYTGLTYDTPSFRGFSSPICWIVTSDPDQPTCQPIFTVGTHWKHGGTVLVFTNPSSVKACR